MSMAVLSHTEEKELEVYERETEMLGHPPRIAPLDPDQYPAEAVELVADIRATVGAPPVDVMPEYFATMAKHPDLMRRQIELSKTFFSGSLSVRDRQLAILRVLWLNQASYAWSQHVEVSKREAGLTSEEIEKLTQGSMATDWNDHDRSILRAVEEMHENAMISDETWDLLALRLTEQQLLELPLLVGTYQATAYLQNSVRFRLMEGFTGLRAR